MKYLDYEWDLSEQGIKLDEEINVDRLNWKGGDLFQLININGQCWLRKITPLERFTMGVDQA